MSEWPGSGHQRDDRYKWTALSNTTIGSLMASLDGSIVIIAMPAIFRGIKLDPLAPGNITYLLWLVMGYLLVMAALVVTIGRLGDMFGRVRMYNLGFAVFSAASLALSVDPLTGAGGAIWLISIRLVQAIGGAMLMANSAAILTDAFPLHQRGMALGVNQIAALAGQFLGLLVGGILAVIDWRAVFWINVPIGVIATLWSYHSLREVNAGRAGRTDWLGNVTFAAGVGALLIGITIGIQPYGGHNMGWSSPLVLSALAGGVLLLVAFCVIETRVADPLFQLSLFRIRAFAAGNAASLLVSIARGGLQFMLIIWLQGIWLPLHGYAFADTPLWAGVYLLPLSAGFLVAGPISGLLSDRYGVRPFATGGLVLMAGSFLGLLALPVNFDYRVFGGLLLLSGVGQGMFSAPNTAAIMSSVPARYRGVASGMRATFQNSGMSLSIGIFFSLMIVGLASSLPKALASGLRAQGVTDSVAAQVSQIPPVATLFAAFFGYNPIRHLLAPSGALNTLSPAQVEVLTSTTYFSQLIDTPFHNGVVVVFGAAAAMAAIAAVASLLRGAATPADHTVAVVPAPADAAKVGASLLVTPNTDGMPGPP